MIRPCPCPSEPGQSLPGPRPAAGAFCLRLEARKDGFFALRCRNECGVGRGEGNEFLLKFLWK
jgi:hypothetical protein